MNNNSRSTRTARTVTLTPVPALALMSVAELARLLASTR
jgi:hypothetical protein